MRLLIVSLVCLNAGIHITIASNTKKGQVPFRMASSTAAAEDAFFASLGAILQARHEQIASLELLLFFILDDLTSDVCS